MEIRKSQENGVLVVELDGRFDELAAPQAEREFTQFIPAGDPRILLDLGEVEYISSSGLRVLLMLLRAVKGRSGVLKLCNLTPFVAEVFEVSNFATLFEIHEQRQDALAAFAS